MDKPHELRVLFTIERRGREFFFRNATHPIHIWHGPYADTEQLATMLKHYLEEQLLEEFDLERLPQGSSITPPRSPRSLAGLSYKKGYTVAV